MPKEKSKKLLPRNQGTPREKSVFEPIQFIYDKHGNEYELDAKAQEPQTSEEEIQKAVVKFVRTNFPEIVMVAHFGELKFDINEKSKTMKRLLSPKEIMMLVGIKKALGYIPGYCDLQIDNQRGSHPGCRLECKSRTGTVRDQQLIVHKLLENLGYKCMIAHGYYNILTAIIAYWDLDPRQNHIVYELE